MADADPKPKPGAKYAAGAADMNATTVRDAELKALHEQMLKHADELWTAEQDNITAGREDQEFYAGKQWPDAARQQRERDKRPVITINRLPSFVRQLTGDVRQNTPAVKVAPARGGATKEVADIYNGLIRNIEQNSVASAAYVASVENAAITGHGAIIVETAYSSDDAFDQDIRIRRVADPFGAMLDPLAQEPDKSDARYGFVWQPMSKEEFERTWKGKRAEDIKLPNSGASGTFAWRTDNMVMTAAYWYRKPVRRKLWLVAGQVVDEATVAKMPPEARQAFDAAEKRERTVESWEVCHCIVSGAEILAGPHKWAGKYIPIAIVPGEEIVQEGKILRRGMVRDAKDPQRVLNYTTTANVETVALQPKQPFVLTKTEIAGYEEDWANAGSDNTAVLTYNADPATGNSRPNRSQPAMASAGLEALGRSASENMKAVLGIFDASLGAQSNETSGRAIMARQREGDTATFLYIFNLGIAIQHIGRILVDLIPKVYDGERIVRTLKEDGTDGMVAINQAVNVNGIEQVLNDLSIGEYDVAVTTGPSYTTRRVEAAQAMMDFVQSVPAAGALIADLIPKAMDWPGAEEISRRLQKALPPGIADPPEDGSGAPPMPMEGAPPLGPDGQPVPPQPPGPDLATQIDGEAKLAKLTLEEREMQMVDERERLKIAVDAYLEQQKIDLKRAELVQNRETARAAADEEAFQAQFMELDEPEAEPVEPETPKPDPNAESIARSAEAMVELGRSFVEGSKQLAAAALADSEVVTDGGGRIVGVRKKPPQLN